MKSTKARKEFKKRFGQSNHFLITCLIGLNEIESNPNIVKPLEFNTSWSPHDPFRSARRSREFVLDSFLSHAADGIDMYLSYLNRSPKAIASKEFALIFEKANQSVWNKVIGVQEFFSINKTITGLVLLLITWRNNLTHYFAENEILTDYEIHLKNNKYDILRDYCNLEIEEVINKAHKGASLNFKEVASLINATHKFIESIDEKVIKQIVLKEYANRIMFYYFKNIELGKLKYNNLQKREKYRFLINILRNEGAFDDNDIKEIENLSLINKIENDISIFI